MDYKVIKINTNSWRIEDGGVRFFLLTGTEKALLIDSGMRVNHAKDIAKDLTDLPIYLLNTHADRDHIGSNEQFDSFYMHPAEESLYRNSGKAGTIVPVREGDIIDLGNRALTIIELPGHTPGNTMFYLRDQQIMFTGDHILFDITPNITHWQGFEDSLGSYLDQLRRVRDIPVRLALPGHRKTGDYRARIDSILDHHRRRINDALQIIESHPGMSAYEIAGYMKWKIRAADWDSFPVVQKWFAVGECLSHLDYLLKRNKIRYESADGAKRYYLR